MDILHDLLGKPRVCACGITHRCAIGTIRLGAGLIATIGELAAGYRRILLVADSHTYDAGGRDVHALLTGQDHMVDTLVFPGEPVLVPDDYAVSRLQAAIGARTQLVLGVGAGVINDLCKYASYQAGIPYMIVATAPSMDGYASAGAALLLGGMKVTLQTHVPTAILADTRILRQAPLPLLRAGYGDMIGKLSSLSDWRLSHLLTGERFCPFLHDLVRGQVQRIIETAEGLERREEAAVASLTEGLLTVGVAMGLMDNSRPASGSEHHLAHYHEVYGLLHGTPHLPHGIHVAYATVLTCTWRRRLAAAPFPAAPGSFDRAGWERDIRRVYGPLAPRVIALQDETGYYADSTRRRTCLRQQEPAVRQLLNEAPDAVAMRTLLAKVSLDVADYTAAYEQAVLRDGLLYAKDLKDRYTVFWLLQDLGLLQPWAAAFTSEEILSAND